MQNARQEAEAGPTVTRPANYFAVGFLQVIAGLFLPVVCTSVLCPDWLPGRVRDPFKVHHPSGFVSHRLEWELAAYFVSSQVIMST